MFRFRSNLFTCEAHTVANPVCHRWVRIQFDTRSPRVSKTPDHGIGARHTAGERDHRGLHRDRHLADNSSTSLPVDTRAPRISQVFGGEAEGGGGRARRYDIWTRFKIKNFQNCCRSFLASIDSISKKKKEN